MWYSKVMAIGVIVVAGRAQATTYQVRFCATVDIDYGADDQTGDSWTDDTVDKPARGFRFKVVDDDGLPNGIVFPQVGQSPYAADSGTYVGCTPQIALDSAIPYDVYVYSEAELTGTYTTQVHAYDDPTTPDLASVKIEDDYSPTQNEDVYSAALPGSTDLRWNHLALATFALRQHNGAVDGQSYDIFEDTCCQNVGETGGIHVANSKRKFVVAHEIGHAVAMRAEEDGIGQVVDYTADMDDCQGDGSSGLHGQLTKEYQSAAAVEGIADFYAAWTWNNDGPDQDCDYQRHYDLDWNISGAMDTQETESHTCYGDPFSGNPDPVDDRDWLDDLVNAGNQCGGTLTNRSTQYDWLRYLWALRTRENLTAGQIWEVWDDADPQTWNAADAGYADDMPAARWAASMDANGHWQAHEDQKSHGLAH